MLTQREWKQIKSAVFAMAAFREGDSFITVSRNSVLNILENYVEEEVPSMMLDAEPEKTEFTEEEEMEAKYDDYGISPEQYHAGLQKLWSAIDIPNVLDQEAETVDVFTLCVSKIKALEAMIGHIPRTYDRVPAYPGLMVRVHGVVAPIQAIRIDDAHETVVDLGDYEGPQKWVKLSHCTTIEAFRKTSRSEKPESTEGDTSTLSTEAIEAVGWTWSEACAALDRGDDPRKMNVPSVLERATKALKEPIEAKKVDPTEEEK